MRRPTAVSSPRTAQPSCSCPPALRAGDLKFRAMSWAGPLQGIRVLDFTRVLAGRIGICRPGRPGAEVLKVEPPETGDETRLLPALPRQRESLLPERESREEEPRRGLKTEAGVALVKDLAAHCDILVENYRPGVMDRLGLGYEALSATNPRLIYCAISGFGMTGPLRDRPSFEHRVAGFVRCAECQWRSRRRTDETGNPPGRPGRWDQRPIGILAALYERSITGRGRLIDVSLLDGMIGMLGYLAQLAFFTGEDPQPRGSEHPNLVPYGAFPAKDGSIIIACLMNSFWERICQALQKPDWIGDPRFATIEKRRDNRGLVNERSASSPARKPSQSLVELFTQYNVPHAPILGIQAALAQPQAVAREMVVQTEHAVLGTIPIVNRAIQFPATGNRFPLPLRSWDSTPMRSCQSILGLTADKIAQLRSLKVIA